MEHIDNDLDLPDHILGPHPLHNLEEYGLIMEHIVQDDPGLLYLGTLLHEMDL